MNDLVEYAKQRAAELRVLAEQQEVDTGLKGASRDA